MLVNEGVLHAMFTALSAQFNNSLVSVPQNYLDTAMVIPSGAKGTDYGWLSRFPKMRLWVDDKHIKSLKLYDYYVKNQDFEVTIQVDRNDIEDDQLGIYTAQAQMAGVAAGELYGDIVNYLKNNGFTAKGIDGLPYYYASHALQSSNGETYTYSNLGTKALSAATFSALQLSYGAARQSIMSLKDAEGVPLDLMPDLLEVPPALEATALIIANSPWLQDDVHSPNPYKGTCKVRVNAALTSSTAWFLHVTNRANIKPFFVQERKRPMFVSQVDMSSESVFMRREFRYGAEARAAGAYAWPQLSYASTGLT
jgi:phage major head subunit gpT-like protein